MSPRRAAGFTLIEVMVALVVVALGMMAVHKMLNDYAITAVEIERRTLASWIATNKLTELSIAPAWPPLGDSDEEVEFANQQWRCEIEVSETPVTNLRRVDVSVRLLSDPERVVRKVSALIEPPAPPGFLPPQWSAPPGGDGGGRGGRSGRGGDDTGGRDNGSDDSPSNGGGRGAGDTNDRGGRGERE